MPSGLHRVEAILATNLLAAIPTEAVMPSSLETRVRMSSRICQRRSRAADRSADVQERLIHAQGLDELGD